MILLASLISSFLFLPPDSIPAENKINTNLELIFTSDAHFGISRKQFRGDTSVASKKVNKAMIQAMNSLPGITLPQDQGIGSGETIQGIDYLVETGDIANRMEIPVQSAEKSWKEFLREYYGKIKLKSPESKPIQYFLVPGNHDISNAIGFAKPMNPLTDPSSMVGIYNLMLKPRVPLTNATYHYPENKINYSRNIKGIHFMFITLWPDSAERIWMEKDLDTVSKTTPVMIFTHDQPTVESKHFTNPLPPHTMTRENKFENLLEENYKEGNKASSEGQETNAEQREFVRFVKLHPNIKAYFHGNNNWCEFYTYTGPDKDINLPTFRVDSPMKGRYSSKDEKLLSFELISLDPLQQKLTVRECLWNTEPMNPKPKIVFGQSRTVSIKVE